MKKLFLALFVMSAMFTNSYSIQSCSSQVDCTTSCDDGSTPECNGGYCSCPYYA